MLMIDSDIKNKKWQYTSCKKTPCYILLFRLSPNNKSLRSLGLLRNVCFSYVQ